jgi:hypothetical protein
MLTFVLGVLVGVALIIAYLRWRARRAFDSLDLLGFRARQELSAIERLTIQRLMNVQHQAPPARPEPGSDVVDAQVVDVDRPS